MLSAKEWAPQRQTRRAGGVERSPAGDGLLGPRETSGSAGGTSFQHFHWWLVLKRTTILTNVVVVSFWIFSHTAAMCLFQYAPFWNGPPSATRSPAATPRPPHKAPLGVAGERTGPKARLGERELLKVGLPEAANNHYPALDSRVQKHGFNSNCRPFV